MRAQLKGVFSIKKILASTGKTATYYYLRHVGAIRPLTGDEDEPFKPGTPAFMRAYSAMIEAPRKARIAGTLKELLVAWQATPAFNDLADRTKRDYREQSAKIEDKFGTLPIEALDDVGVRVEFLSWRDEMARSSKRQADYAMAVLRQLLQWALDQGRISHNFATKPKKTYRSDRREKIWLREHEQAFLRAADQTMALAYILAANTGQRQGDLLKLTWRMVEEERLIFRQSKRKRPIDFPLTTEASWALALTKAQRPSATVDDQILLSPDGAPWSQSGFQGRWRRTFIAAGLAGTGITFHDLRGTTCTWLFRAGADDEAIGQILGWKPEYVSHMRGLYQASIEGAADIGIELLAKGRRSGKSANERILTL